MTNTVAEEVEFSLLGGRLTTEERLVRTDHMLNQFGLIALSERHPYQLSMGQKRRLSVASALVREQAEYCCWMNLLLDRMPAIRLPC